MATEITREISIEDLTKEYPFSVKYLAKEGIRCLVCGEPIWGTLEEAAQEKGFDTNKIDFFVEELKKLAAQNPQDDNDKPENIIDTKKIN